MTAVRQPSRRSVVVARSVSLVVATLLATWLVAACASAPAVDGDALVIVRVDGQPLTLDDALETFLASHGGHGSLVQGEAAVRELAGRIVERRLFLDEALALGLDRDPDLLEAVDDFRYEQATELYWREHTEDDVFVSDTDVQAFYDRTDLAVRCSLVVTPDEPSALAAHARVEAGEPFADVATEVSTHETADFGGMLPFVQRGELEPAIEARAFALEQPGELSEVFPCEAGFAFLRLEERIVNPNRPAPEVALPQIRVILEERAREDKRAEVEQQLLDAVGAEVDTAAISKASLLGQDDGERVVARADGSTYTLGELRELLDPERVGSAEDAAVTEAATALVREWTLRLALRRAVADAGLLELPEVVRKTDRYRDDTMLTTLCHDYVYADVDPTDDEVRAYYDERLESEFTRPGEVHLAYILVGTDEEARAILARLDAGEVFSDLAREVSLDRTSAMHGGRIGWAREGTLRPEVEGPAFSAPIGSLQGPIATDDGIYLLQILDRKPREQVGFEVAYRTARKRLVDIQQKQAWADWSQRLEERASIVFDEDGVRRAAERLAAEAAAEGHEAGSEGVAAPAVPGDHETPPAGVRAP
ncbi:MAG: peptidylprolyl isomerase [Planctomycetes bacterium]|nr:peptidylprolyl isomerase [Planctomycetota bacterium]